MPAVRERSRGMMILMTIMIMLVATTGALNPASASSHPGVAWVSQPPGQAAVVGGGPTVSLLQALADPTVGRIMLVSDYVIGTELDSGAPHVLNRCVCLLYTCICMHVCTCTS
jgi:hypothetical protein